jgi:hypothetical protein
VYLIQIGKLLNLRHILPLRLLVGFERGTDKSDASRALEFAEGAAMGHIFLELNAACHFPLRFLVAGGLSVSHIDGDIKGRFDTSQMGPSRKSGPQPMFRKTACHPAVRGLLHTCRFCCGAILP